MAGFRQVLEAMNPDEGMAPASTMKALTTCYAFANLGTDFRFVTRLVATGPIAGGVLNGDLILMGGGDPTLSTDTLALLAGKLAGLGVKRITGRFRIWGGALPFREEIADDQPVYVGYNPAVSGLNLNFNRVYFEWKRAQGGYQLGMDARGAKERPRAYTVTAGYIATNEKNNIPVTWDILTQFWRDTYGAADPRVVVRKKLKHMSFTGGKLSTYVNEIQRLHTLLRDEPQSEFHKVMDFLDSIKIKDLKPLIEWDPETHERWADLDKCLNWVRRHYGDKEYKSPQGDNPHKRPHTEGEDNSPSNGHDKRHKKGHHKSGFPFKSQRDGKPRRSWGKPNKSGYKKVELGPKAREFYTQHRLCFRCGSEGHSSRDCKRPSAVATTLPEDLKKEAKVVFVASRQKDVGLNCISFDVAPTTRVNINVKSSPVKGPDEREQDNRKLSSSAMSRLKDMSPLPFTLEACVDEEGTNRVLDVPYCSPKNSFLSYNCEGDMVYMNPPFQNPQPFILHYLECKESVSVG